MLRPYRPEDLPDLLSSWDAASALAHPFLSDEFQAGVRRDIAEIYIPNTETWVWEHDGKVVGFISMLGNEIGGLFLQPYLHGQGIGRALLEHIRVPRHEVLVEVFKDNTVGRDFYDKCGFVRTKQIVHEPTGLDVLCMTLSAGGVRAVVRAGFYPGQTYVTRPHRGQEADMPTDLSIARAATLQPITDIAERLGIAEEHLELYGRHKAKVLADRVPGTKQGKLILVSAITPTRAGEGKTTLTVGLGQALKHIGKHGAIAIREPSLGPCLGMKGGATGGGHSQVLPMEDINLHFTGDMHAITSAHNLLAAMVDNHLYQRHEPLLDARRITWRRVMDMNDRALRDTVIGLGGPTDGVPRESGFDITAASEVMAALCLSDDIADLKARMSRFLVGFDAKNNPITAADIGAVGAMAALLKDAIEPNLVQTLEGTPAFVHGGPFANIAHGTSSVRAARLALKTADYVVTEAGFGFDLGAEKFFDIFCRSAGLSPSCVVLIATARALKLHGDVPQAELNAENPAAVARGLPNLEKHLETLGHFGVPALVAINRFTQDSDAELDVIMKRCQELGVPCEIADVWAHGGAGGAALAKRMVELADGFSGSFKPMYELSDSVEDKISNIAKTVYGAQAVDYTPQAKKNLKRIHKLGLEGLPICIAKTQNTLSDNPKLLGRPKDFVVTVREIQISAGAGFLIPITGTIMRMPGLPKHPAAMDINISDDGTLEGLA